MQHPSVEGLRAIAGSGAHRHRERRKLERDLHDGAQQHLMAIQIKLRLATEQTPDPISRNAPIPVTVRDTGIGRCSRTIETAISFCAMEGTQNAVKHAGDGARITITLGRAAP
ncbi:MAG TPA: histidine kinase [Solirubrobacter sp.]|jgi:signal transduction histidine kinase|nr:histidine kinase [Solirubrobacter sp.]